MVPILLVFGCWWCGDWSLTRQYSPWRDTFPEPFGRMMVEHDMFCLRVHRASLYECKFWARFLLSCRTPVMICWRCSHLILLSVFDSLGERELHQPYCFAVSRQRMNSITSLSLTISYQTGPITKNSPCVLTVIRRFFCRLISMAKYGLGVIPPSTGSMAFYFNKFSAGYFYCEHNLYSYTFRTWGSSAITVLLYIDDSMIALVCYCQQRSYSDLDL